MSAVKMKTVKIRLSFVVLNSSHNTRTRSQNVFDCKCSNLKLCVNLIATCGFRWYKKNCENWKQRLLSCQTALAWHRTLKQLIIIFRLLQIVICKSKLEMSWARVRG